jgi:ureidoglycolate lyase
MAPDRPLVRTERISAAAFRPFGSLLERPAAGAREDFAAAFVDPRPSARLNLALIRVRPRAQRFSIATLERHPMSTQTFIPLAVARYLAIVCLSDEHGEPRLDSLRAFVCKASQAIHYAPGIWHAGMGSLDRGGVFAMLIHEDGSAADCEHRAVAPFEVCATNAAATPLRA